MATPAIPPHDPAQRKPMATPAIPHDPAQEPAFAEPWQAQAFACAIAASRRGLFAWTEWVEVFSAEIRARPQRPDESEGAAYYRQWLAALERLVQLKGAASATELNERRERWRRAYLNTPHGHAVELHRASDAPDAEPAHEPGRHPARGPVAVSRAHE